MKTDSIKLAPKFTSRWRWPLALAIALGVVGTGWSLYAKNTTAQAKPIDKLQKDPVFELADSDVAKVQLREIAIKLPISGSLMPIGQATVRSKVAAGVLETLVQEGTPVRKGQLLARFDGADLRARLITQEAAVDEARAKLELAQKNRQSNETLLKQNYISQNAYDTTHNGLELAQANLKSALSQREVAQIAVNDTQIVSPIDGIVSKRSVQAGDKVSPDSPLFTIVSLGQLTLEAQVPSSEIPRVKIGQQVSFNVDGFDKRNFSGKVARINPAAEAGSRSILVYIEVNNPDGVLKGGMFAKGQLVLQKSDNAPVVPLAALRLANGNDVVYKIVGNEVRQQEVKLGMRNDDEGLVQVLQGLQPGANIVAAKLDGVKPGSKVSMPKSMASTVPASAPAVPGSVNKG